MNKNQTEAILRLAKVLGEKTAVCTISDQKGWLAWTVDEADDEGRSEPYGLRCLDTTDERHPTESDALVALLKACAADAEILAELNHRMAESSREHADRLDEDAERMKARLGIIAGLLRQGGYE